MNKLNLFSSNSPYLDANIPEERDTTSLYKTAIQGNHIARGMLIGMEHSRPLYRAIVENDASLLDQVPNSMISSNPVVCAAKGILWSTLDCAVEMGNGQILDSLLRRKVDPNVTYNDCSPLHKAARKRNPTMVKSLLEHKADATLLDSDRKSPVVRAVEEWDVETAEVLLKAAPIDTKNNEESFQILEAAIRTNSPTQMLDLLLKNGATATKNSCNPPVSLLPQCMFRFQFERLLNAGALRSMLTELKTEEDRGVFVDQLNQLVDSKHPYWRKRLNEELMNVGLGSDVAADEEVASINSSWLSATTQNRKAFVDQLNQIVDSMHPYWKNRLNSSWLSVTPQKKHEQYIVREDVVDCCSFPPVRNELKRLVYIPFKDPDGICLGMNLDLITRFLLLNKKTQLVENLSKIIRFDNRAKEIQDYAEKIGEKFPFSHLTSPEEPWREMAINLKLFEDLELVAESVTEFRISQGIFKRPPLSLEELIQKHQNCIYDVSISTKTPFKNHAISLFQGEDSDCIFDSHFGLFIVEKKATAKLFWQVICNHYNNEEFAVHFFSLKPIRLRTSHS